MSSGSQTKNLQLVSGIPTMVIVSYRHEQTSSSTTWTVTHGLGLQYCNVTVIDTATNLLVIPDSISFDSTTQLTATFDTATAGVLIASR